MNDEMFESLVVVELSPSTPQQTKDWLIKRLTDSQEQDDGADLLVRYDSDPESHVKTFVDSIRTFRLFFDR